MERVLIKSEEVQVLVQWPETHKQVTEALTKSRQGLVRILTDRYNRQAATTENAVMFVKTMAEIRSFYNPHLFTAHYHKNRRTGRGFGRHLRSDPGPKHEIKAVLTALAQKTGADIASLEILPILSETESEY